MAEIFESFPHLENELIIIRKMREEDVEALSEITGSDNVYKYIPPFLYKKSRNNLLAAIRNLGGRDFEKKKLIVAGIYLRESPERLVGLAEMFDYKKREGRITIGYRLNENYWHRGIASSAVRLMISYLTEELGIRTVKAFVMPENIYSARALLGNGFVKDAETAEEKNWGGRELAVLDVYTYTGG